MTQIRFSFKLSYVFVQIRCTLAKFTDEQYTTINQSTAGRFDPRVFVNCLQVFLRCTQSRTILYTCKQLTKTLGSKCPAVN